jgi:flagellar hook-associated protein 2
VNLSVLEAKTVGDVIAGINSLSIGVTARVNETGDGLLLIDTAGGSGQLTVSDVGSGSVAKNLKIAGTSVEVDLGGVPTKVIDGSQTLRVTLDADDSLQDLVTKINALGGDIAASIFNSGSGATPFRLSLNSQVSGAAGELLIDASALNVNFLETAAAQDAQLLVGSLDSPIPGGLVSSSNNDFEDVLDGVKLTVHAASTTAQNVTVDKTADNIAAGIKLFVDQYNKLRDKVKEVATYDAEQNTIGVLFGTTEILQIDLQLTGALSSRIFGAGPIQSFEAIGVSPDAQGNLQFDDQKFRSKYAADADAVERFFTQAGNGAAARLLDVTKRLAGAESSTLVNKAIALQRTIENNEAQIKRMNTTLERQRELMVKQFAHLEQVISKMQSRLTSIARIQPIPFSTASRSNGG